MISKVKQKRYSECAQEIIRLLDLNQMHYSVLMKNNPLCFVINWSNKNKNGEIVTNTDNIEMYFSIYDSLFIFSVRRIYDTNGKNLPYIQQIIAVLNSVGMPTQNYFIDDEGFVGMELKAKDLLIDFALKIILTYRNFFIESDFIINAFDWDTI